MRRQQEHHIQRTLLRQRLLLVLVCGGFAVLAVKLVSIQLYGHDRLVAEANARHIRSVVQKPIRGPIYDRNERLLAVSTPVDTVWAEARKFCPATEQWPDMLRILKLKQSGLSKACRKRQADDFKNNFMYVKRQISPLLAEQVMALKVPGM